MVLPERQMTRRKLPEILVDFIEVLQADFGFSFKEKTIGRFGDPHLIFSNSPFSVYIYGECGEVWFIEISHESLLNEWYDTALIREIIVNKVDTDLMTLEEKLSFWKEHLAEVKRLFNDDEKSVHDELKSRQMERAKRMLPKFYNE